MKFGSYYNNLGINAFSIFAVLEKADFLTFPKLMLILPVVAHRGMVKQLARSTFRFVSFEQYFIENVSFFYNFGDRYTAALAPTVNALQFLNEIGVLQFQDGGAVVSSDLPFNVAMGKRAERVHRASANIAALISGDAEAFYLNARIEL